VSVKCFAKPTPKPHIRAMKTHLAFLSGAVAAVLALVTVGVPQAAASGVLAPHRAAYDLSLGTVRSGNQWASVQGRIVIEIADACDGYTVNERIFNRLTGNDGNITEWDMSISSWEAKAGDTLRFSIRNEVNGRAVEVFDGTAEVHDEGGRAIFTTPEDREIELPRGTIFLVEHNIQLIEAAREGRRTHRAIVFDGNGDDGLYRASTVFGSVREAEESGGLNAPLNGMASWPVRVSYFMYGDNAMAPEYEVGFRMYENGVVSDLELDYGDFVIRGKLSHLTIFPETDC
jgi:hypothetical protein